MKKSKRTIVLVVVVVVLLLALVSCRDTLGAIKDQLTGRSDAVQEEDTTQWAELTGDSLSLEGIADPGETERFLPMLTEAGIDLDNLVIAAFTLDGHGHRARSRPQPCAQPLRPPRQHRLFPPRKGQCGNAGRIRVRGPQRHRRRDLSQLSRAVSV